MKLMELFDTKISDRKLSKEFNHQVLKKKRIDKIRARYKGNNNSGAFGYVKQSGDPHLINKRSHEATNLNDDAYYMYIKTIVDKNVAESNPFFPRVYDIKTFTDPKGNSRYSIKLEKLIDLADISEDEFKTLLNNIFKNSDELYNSIKNINLKFGNDLSTREIFYTIIDTNLRKVETLKNQNAIEAINIINEIKNKNTKFSWDLHAANAMVRRGPYGIQLVITDPLS